MGLKKFVNTTPAELTALGVVSLSDKPNLVSSYGVGSLSPTNLKLWFDQIGKFLADKLNVIQDTLGSDEAAKYVKLDISGLDTEKEASAEFEYSLQDFVDSLTDGKFANYVQVYEKASDLETKALQAVINNIAASLSSLEELSDNNITEHSDIRAEIDSDISSHNTSAYSHSDIRTKITTDISSHNTNPNSHSEAMALKFNRADIMSSFVGEDTLNAEKVPSSKALSEVITIINNSIDSVDNKANLAIESVTYNSTTGVIEFTRTNGEKVTYDLPSEKILKSGASYYDDTEKKLHLILMDDSDIEIDVSSLVDNYYGDEDTISLFSESGSKKFKIKDSYKQKIDSYETTLNTYRADIDSLQDDKVNKTDIVDNLTTADSTKVVSAKQAKILKEQLDSQNNVINGSYKNVSYDNSTASLSFTTNGGTTKTISLPMESFVTSGSFDASTNMVTLVVANGQSISFDLSALIDYYYGDDNTIEVYQDANDNYKHKIRVKSDYLDPVNSEINGLKTRMSTAEEEIVYLERIDELGSIGRADGETLIMDETTGDLTVRKIKLSDETVLDFIKISRTDYEALATKATNTLYLIIDNSTTSIAFGDNIVYSGGVKDTETGNLISFRVLTKAAYEGLSTKDSSKLYIINNEGALSFALGSLYLDTGSEDLTNAINNIAAIKLAHTTLTGGSSTAIFNALSVNGISLTSGTYTSVERCLQC